MLARIARRVGATTTQLGVTAACLALLLAAIGYAFLADDRQDPMPRTGSPLPTTPDAVKYQVPHKTPGDDGEVRVVEKGYSPIKDSGGDDLVSYGAIVENTSRKMAAAFVLRLRIVDADGKNLVGRISDYALDSEPAFVMPGQRIGVSDCVYVKGPGVASVTMTVGEVAWYAVDPKRYYSAQLTGTVLKTGWQKGRGQVPHWSEDGIKAVPAGDSLVVEFEVESAYTKLLNRPNAAMIFRNAKGAVVGGAPRHPLGVYTQFPPGKSRHVIRVNYGPPAGIDLSTIELHPYPS